MEIRWRAFLKYYIGMFKCYKKHIDMLMLRNYNVSMQAVTKLVYECDIHDSYLHRNGRNNTWNHWDKNRSL
ncbi:hypothetical protein J23TS9_34580 [Paenibacillus sp. J23TS9]|nr:hypothetical protein J23TS9_34580 [Paenibacillus sp. J23TS9]